MLKLACDTLISFDVLAEPKMVELKTQFNSTFKALSIQQEHTLIVHLIENDFLELVFGVNSKKTREEWI